MPGLDPGSLALGGVGLGLEIFGGLSAANAAKQKAQAEKNIAGFEVQQNMQKQLSMELDNRRRQQEDVRTAQAARSMALASATQGGSQFSSGVQGGYGNISGATGNNLLNLSQSRQIGEQMFMLDNQISAQKMNIADLSGKMATDQGIMSLGKDLLGASSTFGKLTS